MSQFCFCFLCHHHLAECLSPANNFSLSHSEFRDIFFHFHHHGTQLMASQTWQKGGQFKIPSRVSVRDRRDCEITTRMKNFNVIENEKTLLEKKTDVPVYLEININCWEWEIFVWKKEITMRDQLLVFLSRWATASQQSVFWQEVLSFLRRTCSFELGVAIRTATASTS